MCTTKMLIYKNKSIYVMYVCMYAVEAVCQWLANASNYKFNLSYIYLYLF